MKAKILFTCLVLLISGVIVSAQTAPVQGKVVLKKADGTTVPVADALIEVYRTDISKGKLPSAKTDKKGFFAFAGFPFGQTFALVVSAPGIRPEIYPNVKAGMQDITITVFEGDGKKYTEEEVRQFLQRGASTQPQQATLTEEQKKQIEEEKKRIAEIEAKNKKIEETNAIIRRALEEGIKALDAKNYDLAVAKFDEGINADPEFVGSVPVLQSNKAVALTRKAVEKYNEIAKERDQNIRSAGLAIVKDSLFKAIEATERALQILSTATESDPAAQKNYEQQKYRALSLRLDSYRLLFGTRADTTKSKEALQALAEYEAVEKDKALIEKARLNLATALREAGDSENAIPIYRKILEESPDNFDAMAGLGLCLFNVGVINQNKEQMQEGLDIMQRFADSAPETHPLKQSVKDAVYYLKTQEKLTPQKTTKPTTTRKKG